MSTVVAFKHKDIVYLAADTQVTIGDSKRELKSLNCQKIWKVDGIDNCVMGGVGLLRDINYVHHCIKNLIPEEKIKLGEVNIGTIMGEVVPKIYDGIKAYTKHFDETQTQMLSSFFLAYKDKCYTITEDGNVDEVVDFSALGSGEDYAISTMQLSRGKTTEQKILDGLKAASDINLYVNDKYVIIDTKDTKLKYLDSK